MTQSFILEGISIDRPAADVFKFVSDRHNLPLWTKAFSKITPDGASFETPDGVAPIGLDVVAQAPAGTVDWIMRFPDGRLEHAYSRAVPESPTRTHVQFFFAPALPPEVLVEAIPKLSATIRAELAQLKSLLGFPR